MDFTEIHTQYAGGELYCHDAAGWRRDRVAARPTDWPVQIRPDWVGEIVSPKHERQDLVDKPRVLHAAEVPHYWVLDPEERILLVHRWSRDATSSCSARPRGSPCAPSRSRRSSSRVGVLFGDDEGAQ